MELITATERSRECVNGDRQVTLVIVTMLGDLRVCRRERPLFVGDWCLGYLTTGWRYAASTQPLIPQLSLALVNADQQNDKILTKTRVKE